MIIKNLFEASVKEDIIARINKLTPDAQRQWGKMNVAQMLAHVQVPLGVGIGAHTLPRSLMGRVFGRFVKPILYNEKPFKHGLPTDKSFIKTQQHDFEKERQALIKMINEFTEDRIVDKPHPFFGKMSKEEWSKGTWKHLDHHLTQFGV